MSYFLEKECHNFFQRVLDDSSSLQRDFFMKESYVIDEVSKEVANRS
jgi:hypothetical protein